MSNASRIALAVAVSVLSFGAVVPVALAATPNWDVTGTYVFDQEYLGGHYPVNVTLAQDISGNVTGSANNLPGAYTWVIDSGSVSGDTLSFTAHYTATADAVTPLTVLHVTTSISGGTMSGTWDDNYLGGARSGGWSTTSGHAVVPCNASTFDGFTLGSVNGQGGWSITGPYDQAVVDNTYGFSTFGCKALRLSDALTSRSFGDWIFTPSVANEVGETGAVNGGFSSGARQNHFEATFDLASVLPALQAGMHLSVSPDRGDGARMSYLRFEDQADGIHVFFDDVTDVGPLGTTADFNETDIATLDRTLAHTAKFVIDLNDGASNDVVKIYIDGVLKITGTTWEDYYRFDPEQAGSGNQIPTIDSLIVQARGTGHAGNAGKGFILDNFTESSSIVPVLPQTISVTSHAPTSAVYGDAFSVAAIASSTLPVDITTSGGCVGTSTITMISGTTACEVHYNQAGAGYYLAAPEVIETVTATKRPITITAQANTKVYDGSTSALTASTLTAGTLATGDTGTFTETYDTKVVGTGKTLTPAVAIVNGALADMSANYLITPVTATTGVITKKTLNVTPSSPNKVYDGTTSATLSFADDRILGDVFTLSGTAHFANKNVGAGKVVTIDSVVSSGADKDNYVLAVTGTLILADITPKPVTLTAQANTKVYNGNTTSATRPTLNTPLAGSDIGLFAQTYDTKDVGTGKTLTPSVTFITDTSLADVSGNYTVTLVPAAVGTITEKPITMTGTSVASKVYDNTTAATLVFTSPTLVGVVGGDSVSPVTGSAVGVFNNEHVGTNKPVTVSGITLTGAQAGNYTLTQPTGVKGTITVRPITVTATANTKVYDQLTTATALPTITLGTLASGDTATLSETYTTKDVGAGNKVVVPAAVVSDGNSGNDYAVTLVNNTTSTITPKTLVVTAVGVNKVYDATTTASVTFSDNRISGDVFTVAGTALFADKNVGSGKTVSVTGIALTGTDSANYTPNTTATTDANITTKALTVSATAADKVFDGNTTATVALTNNALSGDTVTQTATSANFDTASVGTGKTVTILGITLGSIDAPNYALTATSTTATASITAAPSSGGGGGGGVACAAGTSFSFTTFRCEPIGQVAGVSTTTGSVLGASTFNFTKNLSFGMRNNDVIELQKFLIAKGYSIPLGATGFFGTQTVAAVKAFQKDHSLPQTGFVGPLTRAVLNKG